MKNKTGGKPRTSTRARVRGWDTTISRGPLGLEPLERRLLLTVPGVISMARNAPATQFTSATSLVYSVTFNEPVTGVDINDFLITSPGVAVTGLTVAGSGAAYQVTLTGIVGSGDVQLGLLDNDSNVDASAT